MATETFDIVITESGASSARKSIDSIATAADKAEASAKALGDQHAKMWGTVQKDAAGAASSVTQVRSSITGFQTSLSGVPGLMQRAFASAPIQAVASAARVGTAAVSGFASGLRQGAADGWAQAAALNQTAKATAGASSEMEGATASIDRMGSGFRRTIALVGSLATALGGKMFLELQQEVDAVNNSLAGVSQYGASTGANLQRLGQISASTGTSLKANADALMIVNQALSEGQGRVQQYAGGVSMLQVQGMRAEQVISGLAGTFQRNRISQEQAAKAQQAWTQSIQDGSLSLGQYNTIAENSRLLAAGIAQAFGVSTMEFSRFVAEGKISAQQLMQLTQQAIQNINSIPPPQPTIAQGFEMLRQSMLNYVATSTQAASFSNALANVLTLVSQNIGPVITAVGVLTGVFAGLVAIQVISWVYGLIAGFTGLLVAIAPVVVSVGGAIAIIGTLAAAFIALAKVIAETTGIFPSFLKGLDATLDYFKNLASQAGAVITSIKSLGDSVDKNGESARRTDEIMKNFNGTLTEARAKAQGLTGDTNNLAGANRQLAASADAARASYDTLYSSVYKTSNAYQAMATSADQAAHAAGQAAMAMREAAEAQEAINSALSRRPTPDTQTSVFGNMQMSGVHFNASMDRYELNKNGFWAFMGGATPTSGQYATAMKEVEKLNQQYRQQQYEKGSSNIDKFISGLKSSVSAGTLDAGAAIAQLQQKLSLVSGGVGTSVDPKAYAGQLQNAIGELTKSVNDNTSATRTLNDRMSPQGFDPTTMGRVFVPNEFGHYQEMLGGSPNSNTNDNGQAPSSSILSMGNNYRGGGGGGGMYAVDPTTFRQTVIINTPNLDSFRKSQRQIAADARKSLAS